MPRQKSEDLIVMKAFAGRTQDWADIQGVVRAQTNLDWQYVIEQLSPLCDLKESPETVTRLLEFRDQIKSDGLAE